MSTTLNLLNIIYDDIPNPWLGGGGAIRALEIYKRFPSDFSITLLTGSYPGAKPVENKLNVKYVRLGLPWSYSISRITFALCVPFYLLKHKFDLIIEDYSAFSPCFSFFFTKKPVIGSFQNLHSQKSAKGKGYVKGLFAQIFDFVALRYFRYYTAVSPNLVSMISKRAVHKQNIRLIGVGVSDKLFGIEKAHTQAQSYILYIGRIEINQKGLDTLLNAYSLLEKRPKLVIAGAGFDFEKVKKLVSELNLKDVEFTGRYSLEQELDLLKGAICAVMPSRFEGFPMVGLEILASGTAMIGTKIPGTLEMVQDNGLLVQSENVQELAGALERIIRDKPFREELGKKGRERARKFTWDRISSEWLEYVRYVKSIDSKSSDKE